MHLDKLGKSFASETLSPILCHRAGSHYRGITDQFLIWLVLKCLEKSNCKSGNKMNKIYGPTRAHGFLPKFEILKSTKLMSGRFRKHTCWQTLIPRVNHFWQCNPAQGTETWVVDMNGLFKIESFPSIRTIVIISKLTAPFSHRFSIWLSRSPILLINECWRIRKMFCYCSFVINFVPLGLVALQRHYRPIIFNLTGFKTSGKNQIARPEIKLIKFTVPPEHMVFFLQILNSWKPQKRDHIRKNVCWQILIPRVKNFRQNWP